MKKQEIKYEFSSPHSDLQETVEYVFERTGVRVTQTDVLRTAIDRPDEVPVFAVSHEYVMTELIPETFDPTGDIRRHRKLSASIKKIGSRSFAKGVLYRLHPSFIERLSNVGAISSNELPPHTLTYLTSRRARIGWQMIADLSGKENIWTKWMPSEIFQPSDPIVIKLEDLRVCKFRVLSALTGELKISERKTEQETQIVPWQDRIAIEAERVWNDLLAKQCSPSKNNIKDILAKWCRQNGIVTDKGKFPTEQYIARHVLSHWKPPIPKAKQQL